MKYLFELGREYEMSKEEIFALLEKNNISYITESREKPFLIISTDKKIDLRPFFNTLGGSLSAGIALEDTGNQEQTILEHLLKKEGKIPFCIQSEDKYLGKNIKRALKEAGRSARYIPYNNTATVLHNKLIEKEGYFIVLDGEVFLIKALQDIESFRKRDREKPGVDSKSGMLPPKLARTMINLGAKDEDIHILDAFCGSGVLLLEAYTLGYTHIYGRDLSPKAIEDSKKNRNWIESTANNPKNKTFSLKVYDARKLDKDFTEESLDLIVSEPYMGKPLSGKESEQFLQNQADELAELFVDAFVAFSKILKKGGRVVFLVPQFRTRNDWITVNIDKAIKTSGLKPLPFKENKTLLYSRPGQHVGRRIWRFEK